MKISTVALCAAFVAALIPAMASANVVAVQVINSSDRCAWITVYGADWATPWSIIKAPDDSKPRFLKPGEKHAFAVTWGTAYTEVKVRAEVKQTADCAGHNTGDTWDVKKPGENDRRVYLTATLGGASGKYWMQIP